MTKEGTPMEGTEVALETPTCRALNKESDLEIGQWYWVHYEGEEAGA